MPAWVRPAVVSLAVGVITLAVAYFVITALRPDADLEVASANGDAISVEGAFGTERGVQVVVRGFVFVDDQVGALLCSARTTGNRPACDGTSLVLHGLDTSRIDLVLAAVPAGGYDAWSRSTVTLLGRTDRASLIVEDVLQT